jgi:hypothetical protein
MPHDIVLFDGWTPPDTPHPCTVSKEIADNLRQAVGEGLWEVLGERVGWPGKRVSICVKRRRRENRC